VGGYQMKKKQKATYAFIDAQNLNLGVKSQGWKLDWEKFRQYLHNKYGVIKAYLFIGQVAGNESLYTFLLAAAGYLVCHYLFSGLHGFWWICLRSIVFIIIYLPAIIYFKISPDILPVWRTMIKRLSGKR